MSRRADGAPRVFFVLGRRGRVVIESLRAAGLETSVVRTGPGRGRLSFLPEVVRQVRAGRVLRWDAVLADSVESAPAAALLARWLDAPLCVRVRGDAWAEAAQVGARGRAMRLPGLGGVIAVYSAILARAAAVVPVCEYLTERIVARARVDRGRIVVVPISVDCSRFGGLSRSDTRAALGWGDGPVLLSVTNFRFPAKVAGMDAWMPAIRAVMEESPDLRWIVAGSGPALRDFRAKAASVLGPAAARLVTPGFVHDMPMYYAASTAVIHLSSLDALPRAVLEAQASGRVVIANPVGGVPEIVTHEVTGLIAADAAALVGALRRVLASPELEARIGTAAHHSVQTDYSPARTGERWRSVFSRIASPSRSAAGVPAA